MGRPAKRNVAKRDQRAFQDHIRNGLRLLGVKQTELHRNRRHSSIEPITTDSQRARQGSSDYRWVRKHLSRTDPHFTFAVARELFEMVANHPKATALDCELVDVAANPSEAAELSKELLAQWLQWGEKARDLHALDPEQVLDEELNELVAFLPAVQHARFAATMVEVLARGAVRRGNQRFSAARKSQMTNAIASWLHREGGRMAYHLGIIYPRRIAKNFSRIDEKQCHEVFMAAHDTAFVIELGLDRTKAPRVAERGVKCKTA